MENTSKTEKNTQTATNQQKSLESKGEKEKISKGINHG
jgi:hypothetical protein